MNEEMIKAVKQFGREDLINSPYGHDIDENIEVFMTIREMIKYNNLQNNWNELKKWLEECLNELKENDVYDRTSYENGEILATESIIAKMQEMEQVK